MAECSVTIIPHNKIVKVEKGESLLKAVSLARITLNNLCGGDGICGRCKMLVIRGEVTGGTSARLSREEIRKGYVLACMTRIQGDILVEIPEEARATERVIAEEDADRFRDFRKAVAYKPGCMPSPLIKKVYLSLDQPTLVNNTADHQRLCEALGRALKTDSMQMGLRIMKTLPQVLRSSGYKVTATVGLRRDIAEVMDVQAGDTERCNYVVVIDIGTTTIVAHLIDATSIETLDAKACFNSQGIYGREVTGRMITAEKQGIDELQKLLVSDINQLIRALAEENGVDRKDITAVVCACNTVIGHFLLGLPTYYIRRYPYVPTSVEPPPLRAAEVGIQINPRGLLYSLPGISGWVGSDITAGILATRLHEQEKLSLLVDIGTNGEIIVGNKEWLVACAASAGPAFEGSSEESGMRAEKGAIEKVFFNEGQIGYSTIGNGKPKGICGSGMIDLIAVLFRQKMIDRKGKFTETGNPKIEDVHGIRRFRLAEASGGNGEKPIFISEPDIERIIDAKAAIFSAIRILLKRLELSTEDIDTFFIAGAFGNYLDIENAVTIGLIPDIPRERIVFAGNTSIMGAKIATFYREAFQEMRKIREKTTYYDLMGAEDYLEEFKKALFLPHTDIELFPSHMQEIM